VSVCRVARVACGRRCSRYKRQPASRQIRAKSDSMVAAPLRIRCSRRQHSRMQEQEEAAVVVNVNSVHLAHPAHPDVMDGLVPPDVRAIQVRPVVTAYYCRRRRQSRHVRNVRRVHPDHQVHTYKLTTFYAEMCRPTWTERTAGPTR
jgi:hypothetical protein